MATEALLVQLQTLGQALEEANPAGDTGPHGPLQLARDFLFNYLPQEPSVPYRADDLLELLAPSPYVQWQWEQERELVLEGLTILHQLWRRQMAPESR